MEAYHIDRFGSVDGIVRRASDDPRPPGATPTTEGVRVAARTRPAMLKPAPHEPQSRQPKRVAAL